MLVPTRVPAPARPGEPPLAAMLGRASYKQVRDAVDHWLLTRAFAEQGGSVIGVARRLRISRRAFRARWARLRELPRDHWSATAGSPIPAPAPPSLADVYERGGTYNAVREAWERWMIDATLALVGDNVSEASRRLHMARTQFRKRWIRSRPQ